MLDQYLLLPDLFLKTSHSKSNKSQSSVLVNDKLTKTEHNQSKLRGILYITSIRALCLRKAINAAVLESIQIPTRASLEEITLYADKALKRKQAVEKKTQSGGWKTKQRRRYGFALLCLKTGERKYWFYCWRKSQRRPWSRMRGDRRVMQ